MNLQNVKNLATTIRVLSAECVQAANSGHPGLPLGAADLAAVLWSEFLRFNPKNPNWLSRDRFVLSAGHGSMLLYSLLHLFEYDLPLTELKKFRALHSKTPGHPEFGHTLGVEATTGPLGQGTANAVGLALSAKLLKAKFNPELLNYHVYALVSDGDLMEGISAEAASLAGHLKLDNLIYIYDDNNISLADPTSVCFSEDVAKRFESYGWFVQKINGHDYNEIFQALTKAKNNKNSPSLICAKTTIGFGSPNKANTADVHGAPLGEAELKLTKENLGWQSKESFFIPQDVKEFCSNVVKQKLNQYETWNSKYETWQASNSEFRNFIKNEIPVNLKNSLIEQFNKPKKAATRNLSGEAIQIIASNYPNFMGGAADLEPSTKTLIKASKDISASNFDARNIRFGVREHAMGAIVNGLAYTGLWRPYGSTFLVFSDYCRPAIRLAALSNLNSLFIFTHDSFYVGEDGPTHQPIEHINSLRLIPNLYVFRPADGLEVAMCYYAALSLKTSPSCLIFTRQDLEPIKRADNFDPDLILKGAYLVTASKESKLTIIATGSEVSLAQQVVNELKTKNISANLVSAPCLELFRKQDKQYQESVIPKTGKKVFIEAGATPGIPSFNDPNTLFITKDSYGASAPGEILAEEFGYNVNSVVSRILAHETS